MTFTSKRERYFKLKKRDRCLDFSFNENILCLSHIRQIVSNYVALHYLVIFIEKKLSHNHPRKLLLSQIESTEKK